LQIIFSTAMETHVKIFSSRWILELICFNNSRHSSTFFFPKIAKTRKDYLQGLFLPSDFRFNPTPCRSGPRAAWGGEIGGISRSALRHSLDSGIKLCVTSAVGGRLPSAGTTVSSSESVVRYAFTVIKHHYLFLSTMK
jgi:hypothetical protein